MTPGPYTIEDGLISKAIVHYSGVHNRVYFPFGVGTKGLLHRGEYTIEDARHIVEWLNQRTSGYSMLPLSKLVGASSETVSGEPPDAVSGDPSNSA